MTIQSTVSRNDYLGNDAASIYAYSFKIISSTDLRVTVRDTFGVETTLVLNTNYSVSGMGSDEGGNVTLIGSGTWLTLGKLKVGYSLTIRRLRNLLQEADINTEGPYFAVIHEDAFDHQMMISQQQQDEIDRCLKLPETEVGTIALPTIEQRKSNYLAFDTQGHPVAVAGVVSEVPVSAFMKTMLDDVDPAQARATIDAVSSSQLSVVEAIALAASSVATAAAPTIGEMRITARASAPSGWLICDGSALSRATFAGLFSAIGEIYGAGDGSTTFNLPDMRGRMPIGAGTGVGLTARALGAKAGAETHQHAIPHRHTSPVSQVPATIVVPTAASWGEGSETLTKTYSFVGQSGSNNAAQPYLKTRDTDTPNSSSANGMNPVLCLNFIIKT